MNLIDCPWCGPRIQSEFSCGGPATSTDGLADNTRGELSEYWQHRFGCNQWLAVRRDTELDLILDAELASARFARFSQLTGHRTVETPRGSTR